MRQAAMKVFLSVAFLLLAGLVAQGQYTRPKPTAEGGPPTNADIVLYNGASNTLTVQLLNLTPYDIEFSDSPGVTWSITDIDKGFMQDGSRTAKSFMFVPAGIPALIPAAPKADFPENDPKWQAKTFYPAGTVVLDSNFDLEVALTAGTSGETEPTWNPAARGTTADGEMTWGKYEDTTTHPYAMVFSWDDCLMVPKNSNGNCWSEGGFNADNWVKWTVKEVKYNCNKDGSDCDKRDVSLGLWMYRNQPTFQLSSSALPMVVNGLKTTFEAFALLLEPENPVAWIKAFLAIAETVKAGDEWAKENHADNDGVKMWVASYVVPDPTSNCVRWQKAGAEYKCAPAGMIADDAVYSQWNGDEAGPCSEVAGTTTCPDDAAEGELVVSVHVLRGQKAKQCDPLYYPNICPLGSEPVVMITVMRAGDFVIGTMASATPNASLAVPTDKIRLFLLQAGAGRIRELLLKQRRPGLFMLRSLVAGLDPAQRQVLRGMVRTMGSGRLPTQQERQLVHFLADELKARLK